jgi:uncharacterized protein (TIGR02246 family)
MSYSVRVAFVLLSLAAPSPARQDPRDAVMKRIADQVAAWNRGDIEAFCSVYAEDALFLSPSGATRGRQAVVERYRKRYPNREAMGTLKIETIEIRVLPAEGQPQAVTVAGRWTLGYVDKPAASGSTLLVLRPKSDDWQILQDASM